MRGGVIAHLLDVALKRVEVEHKARCLDFGFGHPDGGGNVVADFILIEAGEVFHCVSLHSLHVRMHWVVG